MDLVTGAMGVLPSKVLELLKEEYQLQSGVRDEVKFLSRELESMYTALCKVAQVPPDKLDAEAKLWSRNVREASYDMEDILDSFLVRVDGGGGPQPPAADTDKVRRRLMKRMGNLFGSPSKLRARRDIATAIVGMRKQLEEMAARHARYRVDHLVANSAAAPASVDPRLNALYKKASELVGIDGPRDALIQMLSIGEDETVCKKTKTVSIVGFGGLGKTTLAKAVYDKAVLQFDCRAFVSVGQNPEPEKILRDFLIDLVDNERKDNEKKSILANGGAQDLERYSCADLMVLNVEQLVKQIHEFLKGKRYFIVVDDIWDKEPWEDIIKLAFPDSDNGSRVIATTRKPEVAREISDACYEIKELSPDNSRKLLYMRTFGGEDQWPDNSQVADKILQKCHGIPLAIIAAASLLAKKQIHEWSNVYSSIGFGRGDSNKQVDNMMKILSFSYYDLPCHLRTCMLYLSVFPEDYFVDKNMLIWRWISEGLVHTEKGEDPLEVGDSYFHELINRGLILPSERDGMLHGCRVHDLVLRLIRDLSREENFVSVVDSEQQWSLPLAEGKVRRLALQNISEGKLDHIDMSVTRSVNAMYTNKVLPPVVGFELLRVLALEYCGVEEGYLKHIGKLRHLRYLGLRGTRIGVLPEEVGGLEFLQTLMLERTGIKELPKSVGQLTKLMCLRAGKRMTVPDWIGKLTSLVELVMYPGAESKSFVKELGKLTELRLLNTDIIVRDEEQARDLLESLSNLQKMETVRITPTMSPSMFVWKDAFVQPSPVVVYRNLRNLEIGQLWFPKLPESINQKALPNLYRLTILLLRAEQQDMQTIGRFQSLCFLILCVHKIFPRMSVSSGDGFRNLKSFHAMLNVPVFLRGAMPRLEYIQLMIPTSSVNVDDLDLDSGLGNLTSLEQSTAGIICDGCCPEEVEEVEDMVRHAVRVHPNRPTLKITRTGEDAMVKDSRLLGPQGRKSARLRQRYNRQLELYLAMPREAAKLCELMKTDFVPDDIMHKAQHFVEQHNATRERARRELHPSREATHDDDVLSIMMEYNAALERALGIYTAEYPRLNAMLEEMRAAMSDEANTPVAEVANPPTMYDRVISSFKAQFLEKGLSRFRGWIRGKRCFTCFLAVFFLCMYLFIF